MLQQNSNKNNSEKDLSKSTSSILDKLQIRGGRFEKRLLILLVIIVVVAIPLTIWQFSSNLTDPFKFDFSAVNDNSSDQLSQTNSSTSIPILENLRELDTDEDGLSDYDELYRYKTSPYIQDSDSDSINDNIETEQGTDPNCPEGNTCAREDVSPVSTNINSSSTSINTDSKVENLSVDQLRQIMIKAGAPEEEVYKIPEDELFATYQQILAEEGSSQGTGNTNDFSDLGLDETKDTGSIYDNLNYETLFNLNPTEIRELMIEGGVPANELSEIDDETLQEIYKESLYQNFNEVNQ